jgi:hypothetical protein
MVILWPRPWTFSPAPATLIATYLEPTDGAPSMDLHLIHRDLALHMGQSVDSNGRRLRSLTVILRVGALLVLGEVVAWAIALLGQL